ncbi:MAG: tetratricopeptide repeat protein [Acidobacteriota bacterium]
MVAYQQNDFERAARGLEALIRLEPENTEARFYDGVSLLMLGRADEAISVLKDAADRAATTSLGDACHYYLALAYARTGRAASASAEAKLVIEMDGKYRRSAEALKRRLELQR